MSLKAHFSRFLGADPDRLHFAAHSHHLWPDVTLEAQQRCWEDAARLADRKWDMVLGEIYPAAQSGVAQILGLSRPDSIAFGPNTHSFVLRLLSTLPTDRPIRVLTSDSEFYSFARQIARLEEENLAKVERVSTEPFASFAGRFAERARSAGHDLVYLSHVFYNSGYAVSDLADIVDAVAGPETLVVIDGYHGFLALPTNLAAIESRAFYLAGGYKYAMAGEGAAFLHAPSDYAARPRNTGWYAAFSALESGGAGGVGYASEAARFLGATFDPVGIYRLQAVLGWLTSLEVTVESIHEKVHGLQDRFVEVLERLGLKILQAGQLMVPVTEPNRGHFLTFRTADAGLIHDRLLQEKVITDYRGDRLRFGFGVYHDEADVDRLAEVLKRVLA